MSVLRTIWLAIALLGMGGCGAPKVKSPATPGWPVFDGWTATNWPTHIEEAP